MRILFATDDYYPHVSGPAVFLERLALNLRKKGHSVCIIAPSKTHRYELYNAQGVEIVGIPSISIPTYKTIRIAIPFSLTKYIKKAVIEFNPDVVHLQSHFILVRRVLSVVKRLKIPLIGTNHFLPENILHYFYLPKFTENLVKKLIWISACNFYQKLDILTTPTKTAAELIRNNGFQKNIYIISCGIDLKIFNQKNNGVYLKNRYNLPAKPILLYTGRIDKEKNIDIILKALSLILKKIDIHFVIAGRGADEKRLKNLVKKLKIEKFVTFVGFLSKEDLPNLYTLANCFVIASTAELQSIVTMEAMASGLPIVAANSLALPELVAHRKNGYLFEPNDVKGIAKYIIHIISDKSLQRKMSRKSLELIKKHDIKNTINEFELLYQKLNKN